MERTDAMSVPTPPNSYRETMEQPLHTLDEICALASRKLDQTKRGALGQFMTPSPIAEFMASLFTYGEKIQLLDAGAGVGSLTSAFLDQAIERGSQAAVDVWEIDPILRGYLADTLARQELRGNGKVTTEIHASDFIEDASEIVQAKGKAIYTHAILNPPYKKINSNSRHRQRLRLAGIETVNLYTAFVALAVLLMEKGGEVVAIIPRSFCNGNYYRPFRDLILDSCAIRQIHLFESRSKAFKDDDVLQENVIIHLVKGVPQGNVTISTSHDAKFSDYETTEFEHSSIVKPGDPERFIHVPTQDGHTSVPAYCTHSLRETGLEVCTGPVVDFRMKEFWCHEPEEDSVPLLYPHHFSSGEFVWPRPHRKPNALMRSPEVMRWLMPRGHYVVVKRFSAKEERRRVVAYHLADDAIDASMVGFENHWNVFHVGKKGLDELTARGLSVFLNSTILDTHFRAFSGHTQVNATDLRSMKYPSREVLQSLGKRSQAIALDQTIIDTLIQELQH